MVAVDQADQVVHQVYVHQHHQDQAVDLVDHRAVDLIDQAAVLIQVEVQNQWVVEDRF